MNVISTLQGGALCMFVHMAWLSLPLSGTKGWIMVFAFPGLKTESQDQD